MNKILFFLSSLSCDGYMYQKECVAELGITAQLQDGNVDCSKVSGLVSKSREILTHSGLMKDSDFKSAYSGMHFLVLDVDSFYGESVEDGKKVECIGYYDVVEGIKVTKDGCALVHEQLHMWDAKHLAIGTSWHENWDKNGYYATIADFEFQCWNGLYLEESNMTNAPDGGTP